MLINMILYFFLRNILISSKCLAFKSKVYIYICYTQVQSISLIRDFATKSLSTLQMIICPPIPFIISFDD